MGCLRVYTPAVAIKHPYDRDQTTGRQSKPASEALLKTG